MFDIQLIKLPPLSSEPEILEKVCCDIIHDLREGISIPPEVIDWMDAANNVLDTAK